MGVLHDVHPVQVGPFGCDQPGITDAVPVVNVVGRPGLGHLLARHQPQVRGDHPHSDVASGFKAAGACRVRQLAQVVGKAHQHVGAEARHVRHLADRRRLVAGACRQQHRPGVVQGGLAHEVSRVHHPVGVAGMDNVVVAQALHHPGARHHQRLQFTAAGTEEDRLRRAGGAAGGLHHQAGRPGLRVVVAMQVVVAERRVALYALHQVGLGKNRQLGKVFQALHVARFQPRLAPQSPIERGPPCALQAAPEAPFLNRPQFVPAHTPEPFHESIAHRVLAPQGRRIGDREVVGQMLLAHRRRRG